MTNNVSVNFTATAKECPECFYQYDADGLLVVHFMCKHPEKYLELRDQGFEMLSAKIPSFIGTTIERKMKEEKKQKLLQTPLDVSNCAVSDFQKQDEPRSNFGVQNDSSDSDLDIREFFVAASKF